MANESTTQPSAASGWQAKQVYAMAVISLVVGLAIGYLFRGSQSPAPPAQPEAAAQPSPAAQPTPAAGGMGGMGGQMPTLDQMKQMADKKAAPLLEKLKGDPNNSDLLIQVGKIYSSTHQFKEAAVYYDKALQSDPKNVAVRSQLASILYYNGDVDGAIGQLQQALHYDPKDANSLFNLGMIKWQGKQDSKGALAAWQQLLKLNPQLSPDRKAEVQKLMADVQMQGKS
ncbi:MAG: tetratricopeptide repeat protein [Terriglobales bacterium]